MISLPTTAIMAKGRIIEVGLQSYDLSNSEWGTQLNILSAYGAALLHCDWRIRPKQNSSDNQHAAI